MRTTGASPITRTGIGKISYSRRKEIVFVVTFFMPGEQEGGTILFCESVVESGKC